MPRSNFDSVIGAIGLQLVSSLLQIAFNRSACWVEMKVPFRSICSCQTLLGAELVTLSIFLGSKEPSAVCTYSIETSRCLDATTMDVITWCVKRLAARTTAFWSTRRGSETSIVVRCVCPEKCRGSTLLSRTPRHVAHVCSLAAWSQRRKVSSILRQSLRTPRWRCVSPQRRSSVRCSSSSRLFPLLPSILSREFSLGSAANRATHRQKYSTVSTTTPLDHKNTQLMVLALVFSCGWVGGAFFMCPVTRGQRTSGFMMWWVVM